MPVLLVVWYLDGCTLLQLPAAFAVGHTIHGCKCIMAFMHDLILSASRHSVTVTFVVHGCCGVYCLLTPAAKTLAAALAQVLVRMYSGVMQSAGKLSGGFSENAPHQSKSQHTS